MYAWSQTYKKLYKKFMPRPERLSGVYVKKNILTSGESMNKLKNTSYCLATTLKKERLLRVQIILEGAWVDRSWFLGFSHTSCLINKAVTQGGIYVKNIF